MNAMEITNKLTRTFGKATFQLKKHSPEILVVTGVVGTVVSAVLACKATTKVGEVMADAKTQIDQVHQVLEDETIPEEKYSQEDGKKDLAIIYTQTGVKLAKLYGPAVLLGAVSITSILAGHNILRKRNLALAAAYTAVDTSFKDYRKRVIDRFGKELDQELRYNIKAKEVEEVTVDENGKETVETKTVNSVDPNDIPDYSKFFDESCSGWTKNADMNLTFLRQQERWANDKLQRKGYLMLNDVYEALGIDKTKAGQVVGWVYDPENPNHKGDNFVSFGIYDQDNERARAFVNGKERVILLNFNVDGYILDKVKIW